VALHYNDLLDGGKFGFDGLLKNSGKTKSGPKTRCG